MGGSLDALYPAVAAVLVCVLGPLATAAAKRLTSRNSRADGDEDANDGVTLQSIFQALGKAEARVMEAEQTIRTRDETVRALQAEVTLLRSLLDRQ